MSSTLQGKPPNSADLKWLALMDKAREGSLDALDESAKQLIGLDGLISGIYFGAVAFAKLAPGILTEPNRVWLLAPVVLWLASLIAAVLALTARAYAYNPNSPDDARLVYERIARTKHVRLLIALWCFVASIVALGWVLWLYLGWVAAGQVTS